VETFPANALPEPRPVVRALEQALAHTCSGRVSFQAQDRLSTGRDMWPKVLLWLREGRIPPPPDAVVWPSSEEEVAAVIRLARTHRLAVVPFGAGSGVCGGALALHGGIAMDLKRLERVSPVDATSRTVDAEAGVLGETLERGLARQGWTLGHFPSSIYMSTLGGWLATRSAGQLSSKYGKIEDMAVSVRAVAGTGEPLVTPERPFHGPDLVPLLLGSEGTLCAFTGARLRVHRAPEHRAFHGYRFKRVREGVAAIRSLFHAGLRPAVVRLYDPFDTALVGRAKPHDPPEPPSLRSRWKADVLPGFLRELSAQTLSRPGVLNRATALLRQCLLVTVFEGESRRTQSEDARARALCADAGGVDLGEEPGRHWFAERYAVSYKMSKVFDSGAFADTMEVAATWDRVMDVYEKVRAAAAPLAFVLCHFSHAGSGPDEAAQQARYDALWRAALDAARAAGATVTHHHGVGVLKGEALREELGEGASLLTALKGALDPDGIMNPGKLIWARA
jgi:alkyldihydroxyacetonephosphate synthase